MILYFVVVSCDRDRVENKRDNIYSTNMSMTHTMLLPSGDQRTTLAEKIISLIDMIELRVFHLDFSCHNSIHFPLDRVQRDSTGLG